MGSEGGPRAAESAAEAVFGVPTARASVAFVGVETVEVLRFSPAGGLVRYLTLGMSRYEDAELLLTLREPADGVLRALAVLAAMPAVEGVAVRPGSVYELGEPLWPAAHFTGFLVDSQDDAGGPFLAAIPVTPGELAYRRRNGPGSLAARWAESGVDIRDPRREGAGDERD